MTAAGRKPGRRYSRESQQEDRSEAQIKERFAELRWPCDRLARDLGEDLHVRIYDDGQSTGLSFLVQLKSAANAERLKRKKSPALAYRLEVKDLLHWEVSTTLVVLVVWDVEKRVGWWRPVPEIVAELDETGKGWRKKKTATVTVPLANATDSEGMKRLRWAIADHNLPLTPRRGDMLIKLSFPPTASGQAASAELERVLDFGGSLQVPGEFVAEIQEPPWMRRLYGGRLFPPQSVHVSTKAPEVSFPVRLEIEAPECVATLQYVDLRVTSQGRKLVRLSNAHQGLPVRMTLAVARPSAACEVTFAIEQCPAEVYQAFEAATFELALKLPGAKLRVIHISTGSTLWEAAVEVDGSDEELAYLRSRREFLDKVCFIQRRIASQGTLSLAAGVTRDDVVAVERAFTVLSTGAERATLSFKMDFEPHVSSVVRAQLAKGEYSDFSFGVDKTESLRLLGLDISLGKTRFVLAEGNEIVDRWVRCIDEANRVAHAVTLELQKLPVIVEYLEWLPPEARWKRLSELAVRQDGYITPSQARHVGYSDDVFLSLLPAGKIELVAADVYHLAHFPRAEREDLIVLWLQTDRRGIISHETALYLHDLCDILPSHLHVTVPPGWTPGDRNLAADVEIRHADVPEQDIRWLGPVPYTAPLRTVRDCIEVGVSPELIEQAIAEGIRRGLFTEADFPHLQRAESA